MRCRPGGTRQLPVIDQCQGSDGRFTKPYALACSTSHLKAGLLRVRVLPPEVMSTARPSSCSDRPGIAVGTRQDEDGAVYTSGQPLIFRSSIWRSLVRKPPPEMAMPLARASSTMRLKAYATLLFTVVP